MVQAIRALRQGKFEVRALQGNGFTAPIEYVTRTDRHGLFQLPLRAPDTHAPITVSIEAAGLARLVRELRPPPSDPGARVVYHFALRTGGGE